MECLNIYPTFLWRRGTDEEEETYSFTVSLHAWKNILNEKRSYERRIYPSFLLLVFICPFPVCLDPETFFSFCFLDSTKVKGRRRPRKWRGRRKWWKEDEEWGRKERRRNVTKTCRTIESHSVTRFFFMCPEKFQECWKGYTKCFRAVSSYSIPFSSHFLLFSSLLPFSSLLLPSSHSRFQPSLFPLHES